VPGQVPDRIRLDPSHDCELVLNPQGAGAGRHGQVVGGTGIAVVILYTAVEAQRLIIATGDTAVRAAVADRIVVAGSRVAVAGHIFEDGHTGRVVHIQVEARRA